MDSKTTKSNVDIINKKNNLKYILKCLIRHTPSWYAFFISKGKWKATKHLLYIEKEILKALKNGSGRLIINMPPRHGKSEFISKYLPSWYLCNNPDKKIIFTSYESSFAQSFGKAVMKIFKESEKIFKLSIAKKHGASSDFGIEGHSGGMYSIGAGGPITGKGADLLIIDDPIKNDAEAMSITYRDNIYEWFKATAYTRIEPQGTVIIVMTRWNEDDLTGRLLRDEPNKWQVISLPAIAEEKDIIGRKIGEALWSKRYSKKKLEEIRKTLGTFWFSALYQQKPYIEKGGIFKYDDFQYFTENENFFEIEVNDKKIQIMKSTTITLIAVDLAVTVSEKADYTVFLIAGVSTDNSVFILDVVRDKVEGAKHIKLLRNLNMQYKPSLIGIESVQYQIALIQQAQNEGIPVKGLKADKDKISRALPLAAKFEAGKIYFKRNADYINALQDELLKFPNARNDDQVDALAYLAEMTQSVSKVRPQSAKRKMQNSFWF